MLLVAARKNALEDVSAASLALHAQNFVNATEKNVVPNLPIGSAGHCISCANINVF